MNLKTAIILVGVVTYASACNATDAVFHDHRPDQDSTAVSLISLPLRDRIAFVSSDDGYRPKLFLMQSDGSHIMPLASDTAGYACPSISPDGNQVAVLRGGAISVMNGDGTKLRVLVPRSSNVDVFYRCPVWSGDGKRLAFISVGHAAKGPASSTITVIDVADGIAIPVFHKSGSNFVSVGWSADGNRLLFDSNAEFGGGPFDYRVTVVTTAGSVVTELVSSTWGKSWSPDGAHFAFVCGLTQICVANADGTNQVQLTDSGGRNPTWSPDGKKIGYFVTTSLYVMNPDGTEKMKLLGPNQGGGDLAWSPDAKKIAFTCVGNIKLNEVTTSTDICTLNTDGTGFARLTSLPAVNSTPAWSPQ